MTEETVAEVEALFDLYGYTHTPPVSDRESSEYAGSSFLLNGKTVTFRQAKTTPTKAGMFVTFWLRSREGPIRPYDTADGVEFFLVAVKDGSRRGHFVFSSSALIAHDIVSTSGGGGKRALRVYPPWLGNLNPTARRTQKWQSDYFVETFDDRPPDEARVRSLYRQSQTSAQ